MTNEVDLQPGEVYRFKFPDMTPPTYVRHLEDGDFVAFHSHGEEDTDEWSGHLSEVSREWVQGKLNAGEVRCEIIVLKESPFKDGG